MFAAKYTRSLHSSDLRDDELHHSTEALRASAYADATGNEIVLGSLLTRVKYASGTRKTFESGAGNMATLLRAWSAAVIEKGRSRGWMRPTTPWDVEAAFRLYERVAHASLAHWLDGRCQPCNGAGVMDTRRTCTACAGSGKAHIEAGRFESEKIADMTSELEGIYQAHSGRAAAMLRRAA